MSDVHKRTYEAQKKISPIYQPEQSLAKQQGPVQAAAPQVAYQRAQVSGNWLAAADLLILQRLVGNRMVQRIVARRVESTNDQQLAITAHRQSLPDNQPSIQRAPEQETESNPPQQPALKVVLYQAEDEKSEHFERQAKRIAGFINAVKVPSSCPRRSTLKLATGGTPFVGRIYPILKRAKECTGRTLDEVHIVGHGPDVRFGLSEVKGIRESLSPTVRLIFHGCSVLDEKTKLAALQGALGTAVQIYARAKIGEAGQPFGFFQVTLPAGQDEIKRKWLESITDILPKEYIQQWAEDYAKYKPHELRGILRSKTEEAKPTDELKQIIIDVLKQKLSTDVKFWSDSALKKTQEKTPFAWEQEIVTEELSMRWGLREGVQFWSSDTLKNILEAAELKGEQYKIVKKELKMREQLQKMVKKWTRKKLELNRT